MTRYHSVILDDEACKGCTVCVTTCPVEAIRVLEGKARIRAERCIDCGECIRRCPHHAKKALSSELSAALSGDNGLFRVALPAPSLYGQFPAAQAIERVHAALCELGFDAVFPVAAATGSIARATASFLDRDKHPDLPRPLISSSCPTIVKLIQVRFPSLVSHIVPVIAPMELASTLARAYYATRLGIDPARIRTTFISPCPGKITEAIAPAAKASSIDFVVAMKDVHLPLVQAMKKRAETPAPGFQSPGCQPPGCPSPEAAEISWGRTGGEGEATVGSDGGPWLSADGMDQCVRILEDAENGSLEGIEFLELMACKEGCVGGALTARNPVVARHTLRERAGTPQHNEAHKAPAREIKDEILEGLLSTTTAEALTSSAFEPRPALLLDGDYQTAMRMMEEMQIIEGELPGLDCGCCGAPNCRALAEDIVRGLANKDDCVIILKERYRLLVEKEKGGSDDR
jgi:iron only hydrogenase large subunit-like protein